MWKQGETVRMVSAPTPAFEPFVGWKFIIVRASWRHFYTRLRADYRHTNGHVLEILYDLPRGETHFEPC